MNKQQIVWNWFLTQSKKFCSLCLEHCRCNLQESIILFYSAPSRRRCTVPATRSISILYAGLHIQLVIGRGFLTNERNERLAPWARSLVTLVLYCHSLLKSSGVVHYCRYLILSEFRDHGSKQPSTIDRPCVTSRHCSPPNAIAWKERCLQYCSRLSSQTNMSHTRAV